jgi:Papain family cysteine protease
MKKFVNFATLIFIANIVLSCTKDITPTKDTFGTGLNTNTPAALEKIAEADFDDGFQDLGTDTWSKLVGKEGGGHAMTLVGWDDSKKAFKIANSWSKDLGDKGYWWVDYDYFQVLLAKNGGTIGVLFPNESQKAVFNKLTPSSCGNAAWGELIINNKLTKEVKIVISGTTPNYLNDGTSIDASESESYLGLPKGDLKVKVSDSAGVLIKEYSVTITQCQQAALDIN